MLRNGSTGRLGSELEEMRRSRGRSVRVVLTNTSVAYGSRRTAHTRGKDNHARRGNPDAWLRLRSF